MKIEKWKFNGKEIDIPILEEEDKEQNEDIEPLESTIDLTETLKNMENENAN